VLGNLFAQPLSMSSLVYLLVWSPLPHIPHTSSPNQCLHFATHANTIATCFAVVSRPYHLFLVFLSTPYLWVISFSEIYWWVSSWENFQNRPVFGQVTGRSIAGHFLTQTGQQPALWRHAVHTITIRASCDNEDPPRVCALRLSWQFVAAIIWKADSQRNACDHGSLNNNSVHGVRQQFMILADSYRQETRNEIHFYRATQLC